MISRRRILSRSRDDLTAESAYQTEEEEDVWYQKEKLFKVNYFLTKAAQVPSSSDHHQICIPLYHMVTPEFQIDVIILRLSPRDLTQSPTDFPFPDAPRRAVLVPPLSRLPKHK